MRSSRVLRVFVLTLLLALVSAFPAHGQNGKGTVQGLVTLFKTWDGKTIEGTVSDEAARHIDYAGMAQRAIGERQWDRLTSVQKREFVSTFRRLVERRYYRRWHKLFRKGRLEILSESASNGDSLVKTNLIVGKKNDHVTWRLHNASGSLKVISLSVDEKDLLTRLSARFQKHLRRGGFEQLMAWLKDKLDEDEDEREESTTSTSWRL